MIISKNGGFFSRNCIMKFLRKKAIEKRLQVRGVVSQFTAQKSPKEVIRTKYGVDKVSTTLV